MISDGAQCLARSSELITNGAHHMRRIEKSQAAYAWSYDRMAGDVSYKVGDQVLKLRTIRKCGLMPMLLIYDGPYLVTNVAYPNVTIGLETDQEDTVYVNRLRCYVSPDQPSEAEEIPFTSQYTSSNLIRYDEEKVMLKFHHYLCLIISMLLVEIWRE
uniref:Uncharacterized protein n=1 Tax=Romanomermis culicivorax TaxID=13658 RepID=A0A915KS35_ROMCU